MEQSKKLGKRHNQLRSQLIAEILFLHKKHGEIKKKPDVSVFFAKDKTQEESQLIEKVGVNEVVVFYQEKEVKRVEYEKLPIETLLALLRAMETSYKLYTK